MEWLPLLQILVIGILLYIYYRVWGIQPSISEYYYRWKDKGESRVFDLLMGSIGAPMFLYSSLGYQGGTTILLVLAGFFAISVSLAPLFKSTKLVSTVHYVAATGAIVLGLLAIQNELNNWWFILLLIIGMIPLTLVKNKTYWIEVYWIVVIFGMLSIVKLLWPNI